MSIGLLSLSAISPLASAALVFACRSSISTPGKKMLICSSNFFTSRPSFITQLPVALFNVSISLKRGEGLTVSYEAEVFHLSNLERSHLTRVIKPSGGPSRDVFKRSVSWALERDGRVFRSRMHLMDAKVSGDESQA